MRGTTGGIERVNRGPMPMLAVIMLLLAGFSLSLPGSAGGVAFLFAPGWATMAKSNVILAALGRAFFSIGVGMAVHVTYGSSGAGAATMALQNSARTTRWGLITGSATHAWMSPCSAVRLRRAASSKHGGASTTRPAQTRA